MFEAPLFKVGCKMKIKFRVFEEQRSAWNLLMDLPHLLETHLEVEFDKLLISKKHFVTLNKKKEKEKKNLFSAPTFLHT